MHGPFSGRLFRVWGAQEEHLGAHSKGILWTQWISGDGPSIAQFYQWQTMLIRLKRLNHTPLTNQRLNDIKEKVFSPAADQNKKKIKIKIEHVKWQCQHISCLYDIWLSLGSNPIHAHSMPYFYSFTEATQMMSFFVYPALGDNFPKARSLYSFSFSF